MTDNIGVKSNFLNLNTNGSVWMEENVMRSVATEDLEVLDIRHTYILTYSIAMLIVLYLVFQRSFAFFQMCLRASRHLHDKLFRGITRASMYFFNTNTSGRILNRFSKDIGSIDTTLPVALMDCLLVSNKLHKFNLYSDIFSIVISFTAH